MAVVVGALSGCAAASAEPITLSIGTNDNDDTNVADEIRHFAELVSKGSGGAITIEPEWNAGGGNAPRWDQVVAQRVIDGDLDMGMVPSRAWDALSVTSLRALNAPFVVTSDPALVGATADDIQEPMLDGLEVVGVVGVDLFPESLRHPSGFGMPALGLESYNGIVVRAPYSQTTEAMFAAFGAEVDDGSPDPAVHAVQESSYTRASGSTVTSNVTFFGKFDVLSVNEAVWSELNDEQRRVIAQASEQTQQWVVQNLPTERELAAEYCARGGEIVVAPSADVDALVAAAAPVIADLREDDVTATAIDALEALAPAELDTPQRCEEDTAATVDITGTWEITTTREELEAGGVTDAEQLHEEAATFRWKFTTDAWSYNAVADYELAQPSRTGTMTIEGNRITIFFSAQPGDNVAMDAAILDDGTLEFSNVVDGAPLFQKSSEVKFALRPWTPVTD